MYELPCLRLVAIFEGGNAIGDSDALDGNDAVSAVGKGRAGHDFEAVPGVEATGRFPSHLPSPYRKRTGPAAIIRNRNRDAIHHDAVEGRLGRIESLRNNLAHSQAIVSSDWPTIVDIAHDMEATLALIRGTDQI